MADNNNTPPNKQDERAGKVFASAKEKKTPIGINSEDIIDEVESKLVGVNTKTTLTIGAVGTVSQGSKQQVDEEAVKEEFTPRTKSKDKKNINQSSLGGTDTKQVVEPVKTVHQPTPPKQGKDDVIEKPEDAAEKVNIKKEQSSSAGEDNPNTPNGDSKGDKETAKTNAELAQNAAKQGKVDPNTKKKDEKETSSDDIAKSNVVIQIMKKYEDVIGKKNDVKNQETKDGETKTKQALEETKDRKRITRNGNVSDNDSIDVKSNEDNVTSSENAEVENNQDVVSETTASDVKPSHAEAKDDKVTDPPIEDFISSDEVNVMNAEAKRNRAKKNAGRRVGMDVGRSIGYGAIIKDEGKSITPFGTDEESAQENLANYRNDQRKQAEEEGDLYFNGYVEGYNKGLEEGIRLKREAASAAKNAEKTTIEYTVGGILGTACGAASAKGKSEIDVSYKIPRKGQEDEEVTVKASLSSVRTAVGEKKQTPDGKLKGDALERAFVEQYNMAYELANKQKYKGPEKDASYQAGYTRGYKLGGQRAEGKEGDADLMKEKKLYHTSLPSDAPKEQLQQMRGFCDGYNKAFIDVQNGNTAAKKKKIQERNQNPAFMSGFATGNMQGFLKAMLVPSGIDLLKALNNVNLMKEGGVPDFFPIPDVIRTNIKAVLGQGGEPEVQKLITEPYFEEGRVIGYNKGYLNAEQNRMTFKREQFKMHPDYQEAMKEVYNNKTIGALKAQLQVECNVLRTKDTLTAQENKQLKTYIDTISSLDKEINSKSEYYQRGVIDCYNYAFSQEEQKVQAKRTFSKEYKDGMELGAIEAEHVYKSKQKIKNWRRDGIDISAINQKLNKKIQDNRKRAQNEGKEYFNGYAQGYSSTLETLEQRGLKSDMGNQIDNVDQLAKGVNNDLYEKNKQETTKAFKDGAAQGYNLYFENKRINTDTGEVDSSKDFEGLSNKHYADKEKSYQTNKELSEHTEVLMEVFKEGYNFVKETALSGAGNNVKTLKLKKPYGAVKGLHDALQFNKGYTDAKNEEAKQGDTTAYNVGYSKGEMQLSCYSDFRKNMIVAGKNLQSQEENISTDKNNARNFVSEHSIADINALNALEGGEDKVLEEGKEPTLSQQDDQETYNVLPAEHEAQARRASNRRWLTKVIYLNEGVSLSGTELMDTTVTITLVNEDSIIEKKISNKPEDIQTARDFCANKDSYVIQLAAAYIQQLKEEYSSLRKETAALIKANKATPKITTITQAYIRGYNKLFQAVLSKARPQLVKDWNHDMAYIQAIKEQAGDSSPEVQKLILPEPPTKGLQVDKESEEYKMAYLEGLQKGQQIKSGLIDLKEDPSALVKLQGGEYRQGYQEGQKIGNKKGQVASKDIESPTPTEQEVKDNLADEHQSTVKVNFEKGYVEGFFAAYWKARDYYYGRSLGYKRAKSGNIDGAIEPEEGVVLKDNVAFFEGFNHGRENARLGKSETATGAEGEENNTFEAKLKSIVLEVAWRNAAINAAEELNITPMLERVFGEKIDENYPYYQFAEIKSMKALRNDSDNQSNAAISKKPKKNTLDSVPKENEPVIAPKYKVDTLEEITKLDIIAEKYTAAARIKEGAKWSDLNQSEKNKYAKLFKVSYDRLYGAVYNEALVDMTNLAMVVAMGGKNSSSMAASGTTDSKEEESTTDRVADIMNKLEALFANGQRQNFVIDELDLIDQFYALERRIEERNEPIKDKLENVEVYQMAMEYDDDASTTLENAEIQDLEKQIQDLENELDFADRKEKKELKKEKRALEKQLKKKKQSKQKNIKGKNKLQKEWEEAEEEVKEEIDGIREYMQDNIGFDTPLESNDDILEYIKINLKTSEKRKRGEKVYEDIDIFNNLVLHGSFDYKTSGAFDAYIAGDGSLTINANAERMRLDNISTEISRAGFSFTAKGLEHNHATNTFTLFDGNLVTPKIEGGRHAGETLDYNFHTFKLHKDTTIKAHVERQLDNLQGG